MSGKHYKGPEVSCCIKYFIFGFNVIFWVSGAGLVFFCASCSCCSGWAGPGAPGPCVTAEPAGRFRTGLRGCLRPARPAQPFPGQVVAAAFLHLPGLPALFPSGPINCFCCWYEAGFVPSSPLLVFSFFPAASFLPAPLLCGGRGRERPGTRAWRTN